MPQALHIAQPQFAFCIYRITIVGYQAEGGILLKKKSTKIQTSTISLSVINDFIFLFRLGEEVWYWKSDRHFYDKKPLRKIFFIYYKKNNKNFSFKSNYT